MALQGGSCPLFQTKGNAKTLKAANRASFGVAIRGSLNAQQEHQTIPMKSLKNIVGGTQGSGQH